MKLISQRYKLVVNHSEMMTAYYIVDEWAPDDEQPAVVASWLEDTSYLDDGKERGTII